MDHRDGSENGIALEIRSKSIVGSQQVPYIYEDYASIEETADAFYKLYSMSSEERNNLGNKAREYVQSEFAMQKTVDLWHDSLIDLVQDWQAGKRAVNRFEIREI